MRPAPLTLLSRALALTAALACGVAGVARGDPDPPEISPHLVLDDGHTMRPRRELHDVTHAYVDAEKGALAVRVRFRRPLIDGVFECVHLYVDCDADERTGMDGADLWVRAAVGSRFARTNAPAPVDGAPAPRRLLRSAWSYPRSQERRGEKSVKTWHHQLDRRLDPPTVDGPDLRFEVPLALLAERGLRYNRFVRVRVEAEGSCSEAPVWLEYVCADEGTPIVCDGLDAEWSGQPRVVDATGELHPDTSEVDIASLEVDHDPSHVHALVRLAADGFGTGSPDRDVADQDRVTVALEPLETGGRYMDYVESVVTVGRSSTCGAVGPRLVEFSIPRAPEQTAFRVVAWSDAIRVDKVPDRGWAEVGVPAEAFRPR